MMTGKERVQAVLQGEVPDQVPFAPNIGQWFSHRKHTGTLPTELEGCENELDAMIRLHCDIFCRRFGPFFKVRIPGIKVRRYCDTSIRTPWENLVAFRDACWEFGVASD